MKKPINIVFAHHDANPKRSFLFQVPDDVTLKSGEKVYVDTKHGESLVTTTTGNRWVDKQMLEFIAVGCGAYFPLKFVTGKHQAVTVMQKVPFSDLPF